MKLKTATKSYEILSTAVVMLAIKARTFGVTLMTSGWFGVGIREQQIEGI